MFIFVNDVHRLDSLFSAQKVVTMLLSEDQPITDVPTSDYDSHSGGIIETLEDLLNTSGPCARASKDDLSPPEIVRQANNVDLNTVGLCR